MKRIYRVVFGGLLLVLAACAPPTKSVGTSVDVGEVSFYPRQTGVIHEYLPEDASDTQPRLIQRILGPRLAQRYIASVSIGRGLDITSYRSYTNQGVFLHRQDGPGYSMTLDPPLREYPGANALQAGATWQGSSTVTINYTESNNAPEIFTMNYLYSVVDRRMVNLERGDDLLGRFDTFVISLEGERLADDGRLVQRIEQDIWFSPYIGEILTKEGGLLIASNVRNIGELRYRSE